jgi:hypothetical protein
LFIVSPRYLCKAFSVLGDNLHTYPADREFKPPYFLSETISPARQAVNRRCCVKILFDGGNNLEVAATLRAVFDINIEHA